MPIARNQFRRGLILALLVVTAAPLMAPGDEAPAKKKHTNRLAKETSPYLLLHAHNPVDWYPWGAEALERAKKENKLIFLSIGYSSCYWCHVMERESFMDEEIAALMSKNFVCIKVDREERPDVDEIYMTALQRYYQLVGSRRGGGWPLSMFLTPDAKPIAGGTYFPPREKNGQDGFLEVVGRVQGFWEKDPDAVAKSAGQLADIVKDDLRRRSALVAKPIEVGVLDELLNALEEDFDPAHGGFSYTEDNAQVPKFPEPSNLFYLLHHLERGDSAKARKMLVTSLEKMAAGGIHDHLGGGFHRYSTDRYWRVPHFEKMLYDNGQLASVYARGYALTKKEEFRQAAESIVGFVKREMTDKEGGFYAALDAETDAEEGRYYVWETAELKKLLGADFDTFAAAYGAAAGPNWEERHVLLLPRPLAETAKELKLAPADLEKKLAGPRQKLLEARQKRLRPLTDTKILTGWNGLMIRGLADCGRILKRPDGIVMAKRAAEFVLANSKLSDGRLARTYTAGQARLSAYLEDYAFFVDGLIALHEATGETKWLDAAGELTAKQTELFWDEEGGGFFYTAKDHEALIARSKGPVDGAIPSPNSVATTNLVYLAKKQSKPEYLELARKTIQSHAAIIERAPAALPWMLTALEDVLEK